MEKERKKVVTESIITFTFFTIIGIALWQSQGHIFFLYNFIYIGFAASFGELLFGILPRKKKPLGRKISQFLIGFYMLVVLGFLGRENMQIEGFFFYLLGGVFSGPVLHYLIAKIGGTFLFGRGWWLGLLDSNGFRFFTLDETEKRSLQKLGHISLFPLLLSSGVNPGSMVCVWL